MHVYYTQPKNARDLLQVVNFASLLQLVNMLQQIGQFHQVTTSLLFADLLQLVESTCSKPVDNKFYQSTSNKSVGNLQQACRQ